MRLPWQQMTMEGKRRAKSFGILLGIGPHAGVGFVSDLWEAALDLAPDGDFSGAFGDPGVLVAHAGGNPSGLAAEPARVVETLQRVGLVALVPQLRVRGLDRYRSAWLKNRKNKTTPAEPPANPKRQTETKTETKSLKASVSEEAPTPSAAEEVFAHWKHATKHPRSLLDAKRKRLIELRLAEGHHPADLKATIDGYVSDPWHQGANDRNKKFLDLEMMLRDAAHVERGQDLLKGGTQTESLAL